jgi:DtxR family Mn-dependent transcriptional regulator
MLAEGVAIQTEEFLESVYRLQQRSGVARTSELVEMLKVVPRTVTNTMERLEKKRLVVNETYKRVKLTDEGRNIALQVVRRHRPSESLLADMLHTEWNQVREAACRLEHRVTDDVAKSIEKALGSPRTCPHGNPIPAKSGEIIEADLRRLLGTLSVSYIHRARLQIPVQT